MNWVEVTWLDGRTERKWWGIIDFPEHEHIGDAWDPEFCVYTLEDGSRCMYPLTAETPPDA